MSPPKRIAEAANRATRLCDSAPWRHVTWRSALLWSLLVVGFALASWGCEPTTDVAGYVLTTEGTSQPTPQPQPSTVPVIVESPIPEPAVEPSLDSGPDTTPIEAPVIVSSAMPDAGMLPEFDREPHPHPPLDGGTLPPLDPGANFPMSGGNPGMGADIVWISGWPTQGRETRVRWPLEVPLVEFFGPVEPGFQVGVWVRGEDARMLIGWWFSIPPDAPEVLVIDGQRFVVTMDFLGDQFVVSTELPPDGTEFLLPIPGPPQ